MGINALSEIGTVTQQAVTGVMFDQYRTAFDGDIVPRSSGIVTFGGGSLGNSTYPFLNGTFAGSILAGNIVVGANAIKTISNGDIYFIPDGTGKVKPNGTDFQEYINLKLVSKTSTYTAAEESVILANANGGAVTINLPSAVGITGRTYIIKKIDSSTNTVIIDGDSTETIDGVQTQKLVFENQYIQIVSNGNNWNILNEKTTQIFDRKMFSTNKTVAWAGSDWQRIVQCQTSINESIWPDAYLGSGKVFLRITTDNLSATNVRVKITTLTPTVVFEHVITAGGWGSGNSGAVSLIDLSSGSVTSLDLTSTPLLGLNTNTVSAATRWTMEFYSSSVNSNVNLTVEFIVKK